MPEIVAAANHDPELVVLAINVQEELAQLEPFAEDFQMAMPVVRDTDATLRQLYAVSGMPTSVFIDRNGQIATIWTGVLTAKTLEEQLAAIQ
jgi:peroxiredoxin